MGIQYRRTGQQDDVVEESKITTNGTLGVYTGHGHDYVGGSYVKAKNLQVSTSTGKDTVEIFNGFAKNNIHVNTAAMPTG